MPSNPITSRTEYSTDLTELRIENAILTDADLEQIGYMVNLRQLDLLNQTELTNLSPAGKLGRLGGPWIWESPTA